MRTSYVSVLLLGLAASVAGRILDREPSQGRAEQEHDYLLRITESLCTGKGDHQISRISTIEKLARFFESYPQLDTADEKLVKCIHRFGSSLKELQELLSIDQHNVCSPKKIALIEQLHHNHVQAPKRSISSLFTRSKMPQMLVSFFMHYAMEVSEMCRRSMADNIQHDVGRQLARMHPELRPPADRKSRAKFDETLDKANMLPMSNVDGGVLMIWDLASAVDKKPLDHEDQATVKADGELKELLMAEESEGELKTFVKVKSPVNQLRLQATCQSKFRPIYEKLILPVEKLTNLGYSNCDQQLQQLHSRADIQFWYQMTQICETVRYVGFVAEPTLASDQTVVVDRATALKLGVAQYKRQRAIDYEPNTNSMVEVDVLASVQPADDGKAMAKLVRANMDRREHMFRKMIQETIRSMRKNLAVNRAKYELEVSGKRKKLGVSWIKTKLEDLRMGIRLSVAGVASLLGSIVLVLGVIILAAICIATIICIPIGLWALDVFKS